MLDDMSDRRIHSRVNPQYRWDYESMRSMPLRRQLMEMARHDATVANYFHEWVNGHGMTFEEMLLQLALRLLEEKRAYQKQALLAAELAPRSPIISTIKDAAEQPQ